MGTYSYLYFTDTGTRHGKKRQQKAQEESRDAALGGKNQPVDYCGTSETRQPSRGLRVSEWQRGFDTPSNQVSDTGNYKQLQERGETVRCLVKRMKRPNLGSLKQTGKGRSPSGLLSVFEL